MATSRVVATYYEKKRAQASNLTSDDWGLLPGDIIKRTELHQLYGGSGQGGINPSTRSANVLLFTDPAVGIEHGYTKDGPGDDGSFSYTGEGQHGDQTLRAGNRAIARHREQHRALRLFSGSRNVVMYIGEYTIDPEKPFEYARTPETGGGPLRNVLVFRLLPTGLDARGLLRPQEAAGSSRADVRDVPVEEQFTESAFFDPGNERIEARRREAALVIRFVRYLRSKHYTVTRKMMIPATGSTPIFSDIYVHELNMIIEAKGTTDRAAFRMAIGQLADYRRFLESPRCGILLPSRPSEDLVALAKIEGLELFWPSEKSFESFSGAIHSTRLRTREPKKET